MKFCTLSKENRKKHEIFSDSLGMSAVEVFQRKFITL